MCASVHRSALTCCRTYPKVHFDVTIPGYPRSSPATATSSQVRLRVRMVPEDLDEEAEELEWRRRWEEWMATDAEATRADDGFTLAMCRTP